MPLFTTNELEQMAPVFKGKYGRAISQRLFKWLSIDRLNDLYDRNSSVRGPEFSRAILKDLNINYVIENKRILEELPSGPFITISNHPIGHLDGVILVDIFGHIRPDYKVMVNKILARIETLDGNFICVTPTGEQRQTPAKESIKGVKAAMEQVRGGHPLGLFPAGAVSDLSIAECRVRDREWQEPVIRLIKKLRVPIVPVRFLDGNSSFYYSLGLISWKVRLMRLIPEVFNKSGRKLRVGLGPVIYPEDQDCFGNMKDFGDYLRFQVYDIKPEKDGKKDLHR